MLILERSEHGLPLVNQVLTPEAVVEMQNAVKRAQVSLPIKEYILNVLEGNRRHPAVALGPSPRGGTFLQRASQTWAAFSGRSFVVPEDVKAVASSVLAHRIVLRAGEQATAEQVVTEVISAVPVPA
jgi:MoxR-like ATPase